MVIGQALPYGVGDTVRLVDTSDESRRHLIGQQGTVVAVQPATVSSWQRSNSRK